MLVFMGLVLIATFANKLPLLERLPGVGAPSVWAGFEQEPLQSSAALNDGEVFLHIEVNVSTRLDDGVLRFHVPQGIDFRNATSEGLDSEKGRLMLPLLDPVTNTFYEQWFDRIDFRRGSGLSSFVLIVPEPRRFNVWLEIDSEKLRKPFRVDFEVVQK